MKHASFLVLCGFFQTFLFGQDYQSNLQPGAVFDQERLEIIHRAHVFPEQTQLSLAILSHDSIAYLGCLRKGDSLIQVSNKDAIFEIGSISKVFTSILMAYAIQENRIHLDQQISELLPFALHADDPITFKHLSNHSSGLPRLPENLFPIMAKSPDNPYQDYDEEALEHYLKKQLKTTSTPGEKSSYSNLGAGLLGHLMAEIYDSTYEFLLQQKILGPLKMASSSSDGGMHRDRQIQGYDRKGRTTSHWDFQALAGAGAIRSTASDLMKFAKFSMQQNEINDLVQQQTLAINDQYGVALGWHTISVNDKDWVWHNGGTGGFRSCLAVCPSAQYAIVILSNVSAFHSKSDLIDEMCFELAKSMN